jgi:colanic acid/amylovoran biosynthesis glycosyltransferase
VSTQRIAVFRDELLPLSQTFVAHQTEALPAEVLVVGSTRTDPTIPLTRPSWCLGDGPRVRATLRLAAFKVARRAPSLVATLRAFEPDLLLAHFASDGYRVMRVAQSLGVPLVVHTHGSDVLLSDDAAGSSHHGARQLAQHWPDLVAGTSCFVAPSAFVAAALRRRGVPDAALVTRHIGIPVPPLDLDAAVAGHRASRTLLFVGRLEQNKGCDLLLSALPLLRSEEWDVVVIGDGTQRLALEEQVRRAGLAHRVRFRGQRPGPEVRSAMESARVSVVPSVPVASGASEGFGLVVIEAMAQALPVVAFDTGGIAESGVGSHGVLLPPGDVPALAAALDELLADDESVARLGRSGRRHVEEHFDVRTQARGLLDDITGVLGGDR